ncbi:cation:proton antiporter [Hoyosella altamirensis]|uniref:Multicomponent Na+:H+ antiporter subunit G n=1 Tax=Hoyosella altamirensis TaxID=616997 RepID=A0A839RRR2_9ACTN|nr:monovalent cation/H(+) antiporter subunit G [Hoyosella altamirensis]MBB3038643.1 multicomponent Na+:H+ antiporter subunit G [Hoyosella altamirensis]
MIAVIADVLTTLLIGLGCVFFTAGTVGLLRFPDLRTRIHALTKADNLGLGLIVLGLILQAGSVAIALKLVLIWLLALVAAATSATLLALDGTEQGGTRS